MNTAKRVDIVVSIYIQTDADAGEVISELDYNFEHPKILDTEIVEILNIEVE